MIVFQQCKLCRVTLECHFELGYAQTRWHPGEPDMWYSTNEPTELVSNSDPFDTDNTSYCLHEGSYHTKDFDIFQSSCYRIAEQSFEIIEYY